MLAFLDPISLICFLKGPTPAFFVYFHSFKTQILQKNCRRQLDLNSDRWSIMPYADHLATTTTQLMLIK